MKRLRERLIEKHWQRALEDSDAAHSLAESYVNNLSDEQVAEEMEGQD